MFLRSENILSTPQQIQERARQAHCLNTQNMDESPRRHLPASQPVTPTPTPGYVECIQSNA